MVEKYPKEQQNPPSRPGARPEDQPAPQQRVPKHFEQDKAKEDPRGLDSGWKPGEHLEEFQEKHSEA